MKKVLIQFLALAALFFSLSYGVSKINWLSVFSIEENSSKVERELGDFYIKSLSLADNEITEGELLDALEEIKNDICNANNISPEKIKLHLFKSSEVNAFALPDNHLVVLTGLVEFCHSFEEVAGVMAHEIAHLEKNHVMKKLAKEIGLTALISTASSGSIGPEAIRLLTSKAYDRSMEREADQLAVKYLINCKINPGPFADMMFRLSLEEDPRIKNLTFISTHPNTEERVENIIKHASKEEVEYLPLLPDMEFNSWGDKAIAE